MSFLGMMEAKLPPGFRFHPRDEELICDYLAKRVSGGDGDTFPAMIDVDLNKCEPWDLPETACVGGKEWYFFSLRDRKYATGQRTNRATVSGYWKATGKDRRVVDGRRRGALVGMRKTLVFYQGRAPKGKKTEWVMHEFRTEGPGGGGDPPLPPPAKFPLNEDWVLCRVFFKSRSLSAKHAGMENCCDDSGTSSLPPLYTFNVNFEQAPLNLEGYHEQVPCFSSLLPSQSSQGRNPPMSSLILPMGASLPTKSSANLGGLPDLGSYLNPFQYSEKEDIKAVLDHLTKLESNADQGSSKCYLTESGVPPMWNPF